MAYEITKWPLSRLVKLTTSEAINLRPPYQRNDIWTTPAKRRLIQTIQDGFPLPAFFLHETVPDEKYDMVDGQQRTRAILGYLDRSFKDESRRFYDESKDAGILNYEIPVIIIRNVSNDGGASIREFYYRVNKFGTKLNRPEIQKAQYANTPLQTLVEGIADSDRWEELGLFTDAAQNRMADLDFIAELLTLLRHGITDKKIQVDRDYEDTKFTKEDADALSADFDTVIERIMVMNELVPLSSTRYKQRNDFYTLFHWLHTNQDINNDSLKLMYHILVRVGVDISPSNDACFPLQDYAINCVSQSNSKSAREGRDAFFRNLLQNTSATPMNTDSDQDNNPTLADVMRFYELTNDSLINVEEYWVLNPAKLPPANP